MITKCKPSTKRVRQKHDQDKDEEIEYAYFPREDQWFSGVRNAKKLYKAVKYEEVWLLWNWAKKACKLAENKDARMQGSFVIVIYQEFSE